MEKHLEDKLKNKRGQYFYNAIDVPMAQKYNLTPLIVSYIREQVIFRKKTQQEICISITNALQNDSYNTIGARDKPKGYKTIKEFIEARIKILTFLLKCTPDEFAEITRLTKWDWNYEGEDRKLPTKEELLKLPQDTATGIPS